MKKTKLKIEDFLGNKLDNQIKIIGGLEAESAWPWSYPWWLPSPTPTPKPVDNGPGPTMGSGNGSGIVEIP